MNYQKGFIVPLLLIIIAVLVVGGGAYVYTQKKQENPPVTGNVVLPQATSTIPATSQTAPVTQTTNSRITGLKTYTNTKYGFESRYPESYSVFHSSGNESISFRSPDCKRLINDGGEWPTDCQAYDITVQKIQMTSEGYDTSKTIVDGIQAEKITAYNGMWDNMTQVVVQFKKGQDWYIQTFTFNQGKSQEAVNVMNQILSTFKFNP